MADKWEILRRYGDTGFTTEIGPSALSPGANDATVGANPGIQRAGPTGPLQTPAPTPHEPDRTQVGPEPDRLPAQPEGAGVLKTFKARLKRVDDSAARIPTPGGLGGWFFALVFLLFAVVKFGGYTRLQLVWYALTGAADTGDTVGGVTTGILRVVKGVTGGASSSGSSAGAGAAQTAATAAQTAPGGFTPRSVVGSGL